MSLSLKHSNITSYTIRVDLKQTRVTLWCLIEDQVNFEICGQREFQSDCQGNDLSFDPKRVTVYFLLLQHILSIP